MLALSSHWTDSPPSASTTLCGPSSPGPLSLWVPGRGQHFFLFGHTHSTVARVTSTWNPAALCMDPQPTARLHLQSELCCYLDIPGNFRLIHFPLKSLLPPPEFIQIQPQPLSHPGLTLWDQQNWLSLTPQPPPTLLIPLPAQATKANDSLLQLAGWSGETVLSPRKLCLCEKVPPPHCPALCSWTPLLLSAAPPSPNSKCMGSCCSTEALWGLWVREEENVWHFGGLAELPLKICTASSQLAWEVNRCLYCIFHACSESILTNTLSSFLFLLSPLPPISHGPSYSIVLLLSLFLPPSSHPPFSRCLPLEHPLCRALQGTQRESRSQPHTHHGSAWARLHPVHLSVHILKSPVCPLCLLAGFPAHLPQSVLPGATTMALRFPTGCSGLMLLTGAILYAELGSSPSQPFLHPSHPHSLLAQPWAQHSDPTPWMLIPPTWLWSSAVRVAATRERSPSSPKVEEGPGLCSGTSSRTKQLCGESAKGPAREIMCTG